MAKGDLVEVLVDAGGGTAREYLIRASRAGRRVEVKTSRTAVEVNELGRTGKIVRTARFMAPKVLAVVEHPVSEDAGRRSGQDSEASSAATRPRRASADSSSMAARS